MDINKIMRQKLYSYILCKLCLTISEISVYKSLRVINFYYLIAMNVGSVMDCTCVVEFVLMKTGHQCTCTAGTTLAQDGFNC